MATFFSNSGNQKDAIPSLYKPEYSSSPNIVVTAVPNNLVYVNLAPGGSYLQSFRNYSDLSIPNGIVPQESSRAGSSTAGNHKKFLSGLSYDSACRDGRNEIMLMQPSAAVQNIGLEINSCAESQMNIQKEGETLHIGSSVSSVQGQGLSLSLSTQIPSAIPFQSFHFRHGTDISFSGSPKSSPGEREESHSHNKQLNNSEFSPYSDQVVKGHLLNNFPNSIIVEQMNPLNQNSYGLSALSSNIPNSKYLQATQQLLEEVVNVRKVLKQDTEKHCSLTTFGTKEMDTGKNSSGLRTSAGAASNPQEASSNSANELSPAERQDLHNKLKKLLSMLDEVDQRYKQYYHQMRFVISSFDVIGGAGAAQPYTALALETISRHFRCLKDAINGQIRITRKILGEQDGSNSNGTGGISRLRYVDQQLRQQRALQQMGIIQQHAWRPQRGLPESSVSILRAWLFEHFLHPYPKDSDKLILARQTGLTRGQVRLWKPMVEEMYKEEIGDVEMDSSSSTYKASKPVGEQRALDDGEDLNSTTTEKQQTITHLNNPKSDHYADDEFPGSNSDFQQNNTHEDNAYVNESDQRSTELGFYQNIHLQDLSYNRGRNLKTGDDGSLLPDEFASSNENPRFVAYQTSELAGFGDGAGAGTGGISLTLGLQHCEGGSGMPQQNFVTMGTDEMYNADTGAAGDYDFLANRLSQFGSSHLLHYFVA